MPDFRIVPLDHLNMRKMLEWIIIVLVVGCDGVIGSDKRWDHCGVCGGDNSTCRIVSGLYTMPHLPYGYNLVATIPQGACNINITEVRPSRNYLALRHLNGSYILNGNWAINWSGSYEAVGTVFDYRQDDGTREVERLLAKGPTTESVDMMILSQQANPGIKYEYTLPLRDTSSEWPKVAFTTHLTPTMASVNNQPSHPHSRGVGQRNHESNGGKTSKSHHNRHRDGHKRGNKKQHTNSNNNNNGVGDSPVLDYVPAEDKNPFSAVGKSVDRRSEAEHAVLDNVVGTNDSWDQKFTWHVSGVTECNQTCGGGVQKTIVACVKENSLAVVADHNCDPSQKIESKTNRCNTRPCPPQWVPTEWSPCSATCGTGGTQTRNFVCKQTISATLQITVAESMCAEPPSESTVQKCNIGPCYHTWKTETWGECSVRCGKGVRTRKMTCVDPKGAVSADELCDISKKPSVEEVCSMGPCSMAGTWFASKWSTECFGECGQGFQTRRVLCLDEGGILRQNCDPNSRPDVSRPCIHEKSCPGGQWFAGNWQPCSADCGVGTQRREVVCLTFYRGQYKVALDVMCAGLEKPSLEQKCNLKPCQPEWFTSEWSRCSQSCNTGFQVREAKCVNEYKVTNECEQSVLPPMRQNCNTAKCYSENQGDAACVDKYAHCRLVVQSRLCSYPYYRNVCCHSCYKHR